MKALFVVSFTVNRWGVMIFKKKVYFLKLLLNDSWMTWTILFLCALLTDINSLKSNNSRIEWDSFRGFRDFADFLWCVKLWDEVRDCGQMIAILIFFLNVCSAGIHYRCWWVWKSLKIKIEPLWFILWQIVKGDPVISNIRTQYHTHSYLSIMKKL